MMYKKILLAVDGSENALRATDEAIKIASMAKDCLVEVILVDEFAKAKQAGVHVTGKPQLDLIKQKRIGPVIKKLKKHAIRHEMTILHGDPAPMIIEYANAVNDDLLIIGSRGLNPSQVFVLGSVSHKVMKRVKCPVMVVK